MSSILMYSSGGVCVCVDVCVRLSFFFTCQSFFSTLSLLKSCVEVADIRILSEKNRVREKKPARTQSKHGEKCAEARSAHPQGCFRLFCPPPHSL